MYETLLRFIIFIIYSKVSNNFTIEVIEKLHSSFYFNTYFCFPLSCYYNIILPIKFEFVLLASSRRKKPILISAENLYKIFHLIQN